jgi:PAS domain S-box-containing protein
MRQGDLDVLQDRCDQGFGSWPAWSTRAERHSRVSISIMRRQAAQPFGRRDQDADQSSAMGLEMRSGVAIVRPLLNAPGPQQRSYDAPRGMAVHDVRRSRQLTIHQRCEWLSIAAGTSALLVGLLVVLGWVGQSEPLMRVLPGLATMNPFTAMGFVMAGLALVWLRRPRAQAAVETRTMPATGRLFAALALLIGLVELASQGLGIFQSLLHAGPEGNQMAPNTALDFCLFGLALLALDVTTSAGRRPAEYPAMLVALLSLLALIGYAYNVPLLYTVPGFVAMALNTAVVCFVLAIGTLCARPDAGFMARATSDGMSGLLIRRLFPAALLLFVMGWLRLEGERLGLYGRDMGAALSTFANIVMFGAMVWWSVVALDRLDRERARAEAGRDKALAFNRMIMDNSLDVICVLDRERRFIEVSAASMTLWGYAPSELLGRTTAELVHPDDLARSADVAVAIRLGQPIVDFSNRYLRKDGSVVDVDWSAIWSEVNGLMFCVARDATQRKRDEEHLRSSEQLARELNATLVSKADELQQTNQELESFTYSVSHDLRAPLRHINGYARMLAEDAGEQLQGPARRYLDVIGSSARQMGALIDDLLAFSRLGRKPLELRSVDMGVLAEEALRAIESSSPSQEGDHTSSARVHLAGPLPPAHADAILMKQVWVNLLSNALKYSAKRGGDAHIQIDGERDGEVVRYRVRDNGVGFDMRYVDKLFGVFQRLHSHDEFEGTGVGLAIVQRIVSRHGGKVWAHGELDHGATFTFELQAARDQTMEGNA